VIGDFHELLEATHVISKKNITFDVSVIETPQDLYMIVLSWSPLWFKPFIV